MFGIAALSFGNSVTNAGEKPSVVEIETLADAAFREFLLRQAVAEVQQEASG